MREKRIEKMPTTTAMLGRKEVWIGGGLGWFDCADTDTKTDTDMDMMNRNLNVLGFMNEI